MNGVNKSSFEIKSVKISQETLHLNIISSKQQSVIIGLYDATGRLIFTSNFTLQKNVNTIIKPTAMSSGIYYLKIKSNDAVISLPLLNGE